MLEDAGGRMGEGPPPTQDGHTRGGGGHTRGGGSYTRSGDGHTRSGGGQGKSGRGRAPPNGGEQRLSGAGGGWWLHGDASHNVDRTFFFASLGLSCRDHMSEIGNTDTTSDWTTARFKYKLTHAMIMSKRPSGPSLSPPRRNAPHRFPSGGDDVRRRGR